MERVAAGALCATSSPAQPQRCLSHRHRSRQIIKAAPRQQPAARAAASSSGGGGGGIGGRPATPLAVALLSVVQVLAAFQLALPLPAVADGGDFRITTARGSEEMAEDEYFETVPQGLDSADSSQAPRLGALIAGPKGKQIQQCTRKCVPTCIRGGQGAPGLGPMSMRKEIVVFKEGYRSRSYCLSECTQVCALTINPPLAKAAEAPK